MTIPELLPSTVDVTIKWAKSNQNIVNVLSENDNGIPNVSSTLPTAPSRVTYPWLTIGRVIGVPAVAEAPIDRARLQFNAWGGLKSNGMPNWAPADLLIRTVEAEVRAFHQAYVAGLEAVIESMSELEGIQQLEDPDTGEARYWMDAIVVVRNA